MTLGLPVGCLKKKVAGERGGEAAWAKQAIEAEDLKNKMLEY